jgi:hypothetical protein
MDTDPRAELLRTDAMRLIMTAMQGGNVYGERSAEWSGVTLLSSDTLCSTTHWLTRPDGAPEPSRWRYDVVVSVKVSRTLLD